MFKFASAKITTLLRGFHVMPIASSTPVAPLWLRVSQRSRLLARALAVAAVASVACAATQAATITVTNTDDAGAGSLRAAVLAAADGDTIDFAVTGTITLTSGFIQIRKSVTISGPGPTQLTLSGNNTSRIFAINDSNPALDSPVTLSGLRFTAGNATATAPVGTCPAPAGTAGGAIAALETVVFRNLEIDGNTSARSAGGIVWLPTLSGQSFTMSDSVISNNTSLCPGATERVNGGGLMLVPDVSFPVGGTASATITRVRILNNSAERFGGGFANYIPGTVTIADSVISGNTAVTRNGGGILSSWFDAMTTAATTILIRTEVSNNTAEYGGGILASNESPSAQTANGAGSIALFESTVSGNSARTSGGGMSLYGNVLAVVGNSTIAANAALGPTSGSGGLRIENGVVSGAATTNNLPNQVLIESSVLSGNIAPVGSAQDLNFSVNGAPVLPISIGKSLVQAYNPSLTLTGAGNVTGVSAQLAALANNGGLTKTHALLATSPAINSGSNALNAPTDQRGAGFARTVGIAPDMGAFEFGATPVDTCLDIDGNGVAGEAGIDGALIVRYGFGMRGAGLTSGLTLNGIRNTPTLIETFIDSANAYDVFGRVPSAPPTALQDGLVLMRLMLGVPDTALLVGVTVPAGAQFQTATAIRGNVNSRCSMTY